MNERAVYHMSHVSTDDYNLSLSLFHHLVSTGHRFALLVTVHRLSRGIEDSSGRQVLLVELSCMNTVAHFSAQICIIHFRQQLQQIIEHRLYLYSLASSLVADPSLYTATIAPMQLAIYMYVYIYTLYVIV